MDICNKWKKRKLKKLTKRMYRICFDFARRYFGVSLFFTQKTAEFYRAKLRQTCFELTRRERINRCIIRSLLWKWGLTVGMVFLAKYKDLGTRNYI